MTEAAFFIGGFGLGFAVAMLLARWALRRDGVWATKVRR